ncbi:hypothetical protein PMAYCL1PPCAC_03372, partial [Pristionchus mayeri]
KRMGIPRQRRRMETSTMRGVEEKGKSTTSSGWKKCLNPRGGRHLVFVLAAVIIVVYYIGFYNPQQLKWRIDENRRSKVVEEPKVSQKTQLAVLRNLTERRVHLLHSFCDSFGECFNVEQRYWTVGGKLMAQRMIAIRANSNLVLTMAQMITPNVLSPSFLDPMHWRINQTLIVSVYNALQAAAGFMFGSLSLSDRSARPQRVLQIGLGGGATTNFLALMPIRLSIDVVELEPTVYEVAKKFFELTDDERVRVHIEDGVKYLERAEKNKSVYDSLLLDACTNDVRETVLCPSAVFREKDVIENMSKVIGSSGVLSVNVFTSRDQAFQQEKIEGLYSKYFKKCFSLRFTLEQKMLYCSNRDDFNWKENKLAILDNLEDFDYSMRTNLRRLISSLNN